MMIVDKKYKLEKACDKGRMMRAKLAHPYLKISEDGETGTLYATDSYKLVAVKVPVESSDTDGFVHLDAVKASRKSMAAGVVSANGSCAVDGVQYPRPDEDAINYQSLVDPVVSPGDDGALSVGINAKLLYELAQAIGQSDGVVRLTIDSDTPLKPMRVDVPNNPDVDGLLMPVRIG